MAKKQNINDKLRSLSKAQAEALSASLNSVYTTAEKSRKKATGKKPATKKTAAKKG